MANDDTAVCEALSKRCNGKYMCKRIKIVESTTTTMVETWSAIKRNSKTVAGKNNRKKRRSQKKAAAATKSLTTWPLHGVRNQFYCFIHWLIFSLLQFNFSLSFFNSFYSFKSFVSLRSPSIRLHLWIPNRVARLLCPTVADCLLCTSTCMMVSGKYQKTGHLSFNNSFLVDDECCQSICALISETTSFQFKICSGLITSPSKYIFYTIFACGSLCVRMNVTVQLITIQLICKD